MYGYTFDNVRINSTLSKISDTIMLLCLFLEDIDKQASNCLSLCLRISLACKRIIKSLFGIDPLYIQAKFGVSDQHLVEFIFPQHAIVDKNSLQLFSNGSVN